MTNHLLVDDLPPPPYSETDIYSNSGDASSPVLSSSHRQTPYGRDDVPQSPPSTIDGEVIYTPPLTPRSAQQSNFNFAHSDIDHLTTTSAAAYFDTRPAPPYHIIQSRPNIVHPITLKDDTTPDSLPYPAELFGVEPERDITPQDWQTFVNYLLPHHHAISNEQIINRKLKAEGLSSSSSLITTSGNGNHTPASLSNGAAEAQLDQIRVTTTSPDTARRQVMEQTVREWNEGFFAPRGMTIRVMSGDSAREGGGGGKEVLRAAMPGGWDASFDQGETSAAGPSSGGPRSRFARFMPQFGVPGAGGGPRGFGLGTGGGPGGSFRLGGIAVDGDRVSIGKGIVADRNGLRIGGMVADTNGISLNGQPMFGGPPGGGPRGFPPMGGPRGGGLAGWGFGGGRGYGRGCNDGGSWGRGWGGGGGGRGSWAGRGNWGHVDNYEEDHERGIGGRGRRGRRRERHHDGPRHRSRSHSASSSSSSSSSASESSIGSLPDYDELRDSQLAVTRQHLLAWLHDPNQPITKDQLKEAKQKIKEAKNATPNGINEPANIAYDQKAMRKEVKSLMRDWRDLKKQQTKLRRQLRRERKQQRRAEKRERKNTRREMKRAAREQKRAIRNGTATPPIPVDHGIPGGGMGFPTIPGIPPVPGIPPHGGGRPTFPGGPNGLFGPRGLFGGGGPFYSPAAPPQSEGYVAVRGQAPGAWPTDDNHDYDPNAHRVSQTKYKAADDIESELVEKETELFKLHEAIALKNEAQAWASRDADGDGGGIRDDKQVLAARELGEEIRELAEKMTLLRTEADAEYARELAAQMVDG